MACAPSEDSDQPGHPPSLIKVFAVRMKKARVLNWYHWAHSEDFDQTGRMPRLIWVFAGRTCHFAGFVVRRLILALSNCYHLPLLKRSSSSGRTLILLVLSCRGSSTDFDYMEISCYFDTDLYVLIKIMELDIYNVTSLLLLSSQKGLKNDLKMYVFLTWNK